MHALGQGQQAVSMPAMVEEIGGACGRDCTSLPCIVSASLCLHEYGIDWGLCDEKAHIHCSRQRRQHVWGPEIKVGRVKQKKITAGRHQRHFQKRNQNPK